MNQYNPDTVSPPGDTLRECLEHRGLKADEFARAAGIDPTIINEILAGTASISPENAERFERILGTTADFWVRRQKAFDEHKASLLRERLKDPRFRVLLAKSMKQPVRGYIRR